MPDTRLCHTPIREKRSHVGSGEAFARAVGVGASRNCEAADGSFGSDSATPVPLLRANARPVLPGKRTIWGT